MGTVKNINGRINHRANMVNKAKVFGLNFNGTIFENSFNNNEEPVYSELYRFERMGHHNNHKGLYN